MRRIKTGIEGLDHLLQGGLPEDTVTLVSGPAGSGKSLLCMHFACEGMRQGEPGLYISLEESSDSINRALSCYTFGSDRPVKGGELTLMDMGWLRKELVHSSSDWGMAKLDTIWSEGKSYLVNMDWLREETVVEQELEAGMVGFRALEAAVEHFASKHGVRRLVVDSLAAVGLYYINPEDLRREVFRFGRFLRERRLTTMLITESVPGALGQTRYGVEHFIADAHIVLGLRNIKGEFKRTIMIQKMRYTTHDNGVHPFVITEKGIEVNAREYIRF